VSESKRYCEYEREREREREIRKRKRGMEGKRERGRHGIDRGIKSKSMCETDRQIDR